MVVLYCSKALDVHMAIALLHVEGGQYTSEALDDDLLAYLTDINIKDLSTFSRNTIITCLHFIVYLNTIFI